MRGFVLPACLGLLLAATAGAALTPIDDFAYDADTARARWKAQADTPPVSVQDADDGTHRTVLCINCPFSRKTDRSFVDRDVTLDLSRVSLIRIKLLARHPEAIERFTLFLRSGQGWYGGDVEDITGRWQSASIERTAMHVEGTPAGWGKIDGIRLSVWKGADVDAAVLVADLAAESADRAGIALVMGSHTINRHGDEAEGALASAEFMTSLLRDMGLEFSTLDEETVEQGGLADCRVAIFPYSPVVPPEEIAAIRKFVEGGGKIFWAYTLPPEIGELLGMKNTGWANQKFPGDLAEIRFTVQDAPGFPARVKQRSWNISIVEPAGRNARVIGRWYDAAGNDKGLPAMLMSDSGAFLSHILLSDDRAAKRTMMMSLLGRWAPEVWTRAAHTAIENVGRVGYLDGLGELEARLKESIAGGGPESAEVAEHMQAVPALVTEAEAELKRGKTALSMDLAGRASKEAALAFALAQPSRERESRAVWEHSGAGPLGDWEKSMGALADAHFNMIMPNMLWGGRAHYASKFLPPSDLFVQKGDQLAACVNAAKKCGIEVHVWKVNWNLGTAPKEFLDRMRAEGRTQVSNTGKPLDWLCPSNPANFQLEVDSMLEVARNYDIQGLHFDYIRYPNDSACYCPGCRERFEKEIGHAVANWPHDAYEGELKAAYRDWRCAQITRLVKTVSEEARKLKPGIKISAAVFTNFTEAREQVGQDCLDWARNGYVDFLCPMDYIEGECSFARTIGQQVKQVEGKVPLLAGIGVSASRSGLTPEQVMAQIDAARRAGAAGFTLFNYDTKMVEECLPALREGPTRSAAKVSYR